MIGNVRHPLNAILFGPSVYDVVLEGSPVVRLNSFCGAMLPQDFLFKAQNSALGSGMGPRICFQPSGGFLHHCKHIVLALADLWKCDIINLPSLPFIYISAIILHTTEALPTCLAWLQHVSHS